VVNSAVRGALQNLDALVKILVKLNNITVLLLIIKLGQVALNEVFSEAIPELTWLAFNNA